MSEKLKAQGIHRFLGNKESQVHVLRGVQINLNSGHIKAVTGASGSGKSSLLYILGLLDKPDEGSIWVNNELVEHRDDATRTQIRNRHMGFVFQFHFLLTEFTALENVMLPIQKLRHLSDSDMADRAHKLLKDVGLEAKAHRLGNELSGGEQQRVAIARALANNPSIIFADEPTGNLDAKNSDMVFNLLQKVAHEHDQAILLVTHNQDIAQKCDQTLRMQDGQFLR